MSGKKKRHDQFCWICCVEGTDQNCFTCLRSFHIACLNEEISTHILWYCPVCVSIKAVASADKQKGLKLLPLIMKRVYDNPAYSILKSRNEDGLANVVVQRSAVIVKEMDLSIIMENITKYRNFKQFLVDIEWMVHNCIILYTKLHLKARTARVLLDYLIKEIDIAKMCTDCYRNAHIREMGWFARVCRKPHLIVWTERCDHNYWPAKVMSTKGEEVIVQFFGNHTTAHVSAASSCFLYSDDNPNHTNVTSYLYKSALKETQQYIGNICERFGSYNLASNRTVFDPTMVDIDVYLAEAIPDFDEFDQVSEGGSDVNKDQNHNHDDKRTGQNNPAAAGAEQIGKIRVKPENVLQTTAAKRIRLNSSHADEPIDEPIATNSQANDQTVIQSRPNRTENQSIERSLTSIPKKNKTDEVTDSLDGISSNIAAELMQKFATAEQTRLKDLVNARLEKVLNDERAKYASQMSAMQRELDDVKSQLQQANADKSELQQIADRKSQKVEKRDRQLAQLHLDYNDLMAELHNAKHLCDSCGKKSNKNR